MSGATAAQRIVRREAVVFESDDDADIASRNDRDSWSPKVISGRYDTIKPVFVRPMEAKYTRRPSLEGPVYPRQLATIFFIGVMIFIIGIVFVAIGFTLSSRNMKYIAWLVAMAGAALAALSLLRAQDLDRRSK
jgi:hypothetical protein